MKKAILGFLACVGLVIAAVAAPPGPAGAPLGVPPTSRPVQAAAGEMIALSTVVADKYQQLTVIDPKQRVLSVYHIELATGNVRLCCVRNIHFDLQMMEFNGESPLPREIESLLKPR
jgi:hypothetical protein